MDKGKPGKEKAAQRVILGPESKALPPGESNWVQEQELAFGKQGETEDAKKGGVKRKKKKTSLARISCDGPRGEKPARRNRSIEWAGGNDSRWKRNIFPR